MAELNWVNPLLGGALIGLAAAGMMWSIGRVMGVSGILGGLLFPVQGERQWRVLFLIGLLVGGFLLPHIGLTAMTLPFDRGLVAAIGGGLLVGVGTTIGNGCTSGHGVCGMARFSPRSMVATVVFVAIGMVTASLMGAL